MSTWLAADKPYREFARSVLPQWRHDSHFQSHLSTSVIRIVDISTAGDIDESPLELGPSELLDKGQYMNRLDVERQTLRDQGGDLKTRLVVFSPDHCIDDFICDLYGVDFRIEPSFFAACIPPTNLTHRYSPVLEEDSPTFLRLGRGCCAKLVGQDCHHPLVSKGVAISEGNLHSF